ncbi:hypothetical protein [Blastococcus sp. DSM 46786]|uniref:hypothetical protein n=1 Tax=Blastococcus sp. DSM 46786 TaxID=1798227 RepID=UPI000B8050F7|nr:hypothetical protein [Blastococcus sp. DSM 46786]
MDVPRPAWPLLPVAALLAAMPALAACGAGGGGADPLPYVAEFRLGENTPAAREFVLAPVPGPRVQVLPAPSPAPRITPAPEVDGEVPLELSYTPSPAPAPDSGGKSPLESAFQPSVAWVNDGQYLGVVTYGSSSCPTGPLGIEVVGGQEIEIRLGSLFPDRGVCSADMSGHVTVVELPPGITPTKPLVARLGNHEVTIEAVGR